MSGNGPKKKTYQQLESEIKRLKTSALLSLFEKLFPPLFKWGGFVGIAKFSADAIIALSGKATSAAIDVNASAALNPGETPNAMEACETWPFWIAAISAIIATAAVSYGLNQRRLRRMAIEHLTPFKERWERSIDPNRTSSGLLADGSTNPEDE